MPARRRQYDPEVRDEALRLVVEVGRPETEVAQRLKINIRTLTKWVREWRMTNAADEQPTIPVVRAKIELEGEVRSLQLKIES